MARKGVLDSIRLKLAGSENVRNISVIAHVDHGKSTLTDSLICAAGLMSTGRLGDRFMDVRPDEKARGITIKSTSVSMVLGDLLINLIDSPGHVDFSSEVTAALRVTDGALVVVDAVEGVRVQTETVLRQALAERVKPVLFLNKLDRLLLSVKLPPEDAYQMLCRSIESVNVILSLQSESDSKGEMGPATVDPLAGSVAFGSGLHGWGFTLPQWAAANAKRMKMSPEDLLKRLWGDHFWDKRKGEWTATQHDKKGKARQRGFCLLVLEPLMKLGNSTPEELNRFCAQHDLKIKPAEGTPEAAHVALVMKHWLPAAPAMIEMIAKHLPSPPKAQRYRVLNLYSGAQDDEAAAAIRKCDPSGPLIMYVSKMVPTADKAHFYAFGRVFSGTVKPGEMVRIQSPEYEPGAKAGLVMATVQNTHLMMGPYVEAVSGFPAGAVCALSGVDKYIVKSATVTTLESAANIVTMKYSVAPVVRVAVTVENPAHLPKLHKALRSLERSDPLVQVSQSPTGEQIVAGCGELHLEICLKDLTQDFMAGCPIKVKEPVVSYRESVSARSQDCAAKSANKHNRVFGYAEPLSSKLCEAISRGDIVRTWHSEKGLADGKEGKLGPEATKRLVEDHKWVTAEVRRIWCFGPDSDTLANVLVDNTKGCMYLHECQDSIESAFHQVCTRGVYAGEPWRGVRVNLTDFTAHADAPHRSSTQIQAMTKALCYAAQISGEPTLLEPIYRCDITVTRESVAGVYDTLRTRRSVVQGTSDGPPGLCQVGAFMPVAESFGFAKELAKKTSGEAFPLMTFSHWEVLKGGLNTPGSLARRAVAAIRARKGMSEEWPKFSDYHCSAISS